MYRQDYILRMIKMLTDLIAGILGLIRKGDYQKASESLDNAYLDYLKLDASFFKSMDKKDLTDKLLKEHNFTNGHLEILSELFYAHAELLYHQGKRKDSLEFYEKSFLLTDFVVKESKLYSQEKQFRISELLSRLSELKDSK